MSTTLTVPAEAARCVREGLHTELGDAAEVIAETCQFPGERPLSAYAQPLHRQDEARALLEAIGWMTPEPPARVEVDLDVHRAILLRALEGQQDAGSDALKNMDLDSVEQRSTTHLVQTLRGLIHAATTHY